MDSREQMEPREPARWHPENRIGSQTDDFGAGPRELHPVVVEPAGRRRAIQPGVDHSPPGSHGSGGKGQMEGDSRPGDRRDVAVRCDGPLARDVSPGLCRDGRGGRDRRFPRCRARTDRRFPGTGKRHQIEGGQRADVPAHPAGARDRRAHFPDGFLHSAIPAHLQELQRGPAAAHANDRPDEPGRARLRAVCRGRRSGSCILPPQLVQIRERPPGMEGLVLRVPAVGRCWRSSPWPASPGCSAHCSAPACP